MIRLLIPLVSLLRDENADVRIHAAMAIFKIGNTSAVKRLRSALNDVDWRVRLAVDTAHCHYDAVSCRIQKGIMTNYPSIFLHS